MRCLLGHLKIEFKPLLLETIFLSLQIPAWRPFFQSPLFFFRYAGRHLLCDVFR